MNSVGVYLPVSVVFPNIKSDFPTFRSLLKGLSLTDTLFWCGRLNLVVSNADEIDDRKKQQACIDNFFTFEEIEAINDFIKQGKSNRNVTIFFRGQLLELIRWATLFCHDLPGDGTTHEDPEVRRRFAQVALLASDIWSRRIYKNRLSGDEEIDKIRKKALGSIRKGLEAAVSAPILYRSLGRGWFLFSNYFPRHYHGFKEEFISTTGLSIERYYLWCAGLMISYMHFIRDKGIFSVDLQGASKEYKDSFKKFLSINAQTSDGLKNALWDRREEDIENDESVLAYDYKPLRERPILHTVDGRAIILDPVFFSDKVMVGPLFLLLIDHPDKANEIFIAFGNAFEDYACDILNRMFPSLSIAGIISKRLETHIKKIDLAGHDIEIDACLNDVTEAVIFEMKAVWIREDKILEGDHPETFIKHLHDKYIEDDNSRKSKGLKQLARTINQIASTDWQEKNVDFSKLECIYPVLVVNDLFLSAPIYNYYLATEFKKLISPDKVLPSGHMLKGKLQVLPLIIMTIEDLENLEDSIRNFGLREVLRDYSNTHPERFESLYHFLATSEYRNKLFHNNILCDKVSDLLKEFKNALHSQSIDNG